MPFEKNAMSVKYDGQAFTDAVKRHIYMTYGAEPKACVITYGCQQNVSDSQRMKGLLVSMGYTLCDEPEEANFILFNTCAVREHAESRVYGNVGAMKKIKAERPDTVIAICGCMVQQTAVAQKIKKSYPYVGIVFGTQVQHRLPELLWRYFSTGKRVFELSLDNTEIAEGLPVCREDRIRGFLPIMYGCNNFCTYCIVPYVRGRERSREVAEVLAEAKEMINAGFKEIMLLGQNVNSYKPSDGTDFADLLRKINALDGDFRIRFMTSHPKDCSEKLLEAMRDCEKVERHLHLPVQSGSDRVLKAMNRRYTSDSYLKLIGSAREKMPDITFTSDIIVGFPGETYEEFCETKELVKKVGYSSLFTFIYSKRTGTPAATMDDPVSREEKGRWFNELLEVQDIITRKKNKELVGKTVRVLFDDVSERQGFIVGKCEGCANIEVMADRSLIGTFAKVKIEKLENVFTGSIVE